MCSERVRSSCSTCAMVFNKYVLPFKQIVSFLRGIIDPAIVLSMFMLALHFVIVCGMLEWKWICVVYCLSFVYIAVGYQVPRGEGGNYAGVEANLCSICYRLCISVLSLDIPLLAEEGWNSIDRFELAIILCISQTRIPSTGLSSP